MVWIFGYGSLIWRPDFSYVERRPGWLRGWTRRFWQGSMDHRGVPEGPGRVVTLVPQEDARCAGVAYRVSPPVAEEILAALDHREKGGYERHEVEVWWEGCRIARGAVVYVATPANPCYLGPAPLEEMAHQICRAGGLSGPNVEYVTALDEALRAMGVRDPHVERVAGAVAARLDQASRGRG